MGLKTGKAKAKKVNESLTKELSRRLASRLIEGGDGCSIICGG